MPIIRKGRSAVKVTGKDQALSANHLARRLNGGRRNHDHRVILNGMLFRLFTGIPWRDLPERYGGQCIPATADGLRPGCGNAAWVP